MSVLLGVRALGVQALVVERLGVRALGVKDLDVGRLGVRALGVILPRIRKGQEAFEISLRAMLHALIALAWSKSMHSGYSYSAGLSTKRRTVCAHRLIATGMKL